MQATDRNPYSGNAPENTPSQAETRRVSRVFSGAMVLAFIILAVFNATALERYLADFSGSPVIEEIVYQAGEWNRLMDDVGANTPGRVVRETVERLQALSFVDDDE